MNRILLQTINRESITRNESSLFKYIYKNMKDVYFVGTTKPDFIDEKHFINTPHIHKVSKNTDVLVLANFLLKKTKSKEILFINHGLSFKSGFLKSIKSYPFYLKPFFWFAMKYNIKKFTKLVSYCPTMTNELIRTAKISEEKILKAGYFRDYKKKTNPMYKEAFFPTWREAKRPISVPKKNIPVSKHWKTKQIFDNEIEAEIFDASITWMDYSSLIYDCYVNKIQYKLWRPDLKEYKKKRGFLDLMEDSHKNLRPYHTHEKANKVIVKCLKGWTK